LFVQVERSDRPGEQGGKPSVEGCNTALVVEADVGVFVAAVGVRDGGQDEAHDVSVQAWQDGAEADGFATGQGRHDPQDALFAT
jgi:hypothetical protein